MGNPNCCFMIIAETFFLFGQSPRGTVYTTHVTHKYASYPYTWMRYALWILLSMPGNEIWRENYKTYVLHILRLPKLRKSYANAISRYAISEVKIKSDFDQLIIALVQNEDKKIQTDVMNLRFWNSRIHFSYVLLNSFCNFQTKKVLQLSGLKIQLLKKS